MGTGFYDKNQNEIQDGDTLEFWWNPILNQPSCIGTMLGEVVWDSEYGLWAVEYLYRFKNERRRLALEFAVDEGAVIQEKQLTLF
jgi:hypothetical protein